MILPPILRSLAKERLGPGQDKALLAFFDCSDDTKHDVDGNQYHEQKSLFLRKWSRWCLVLDKTMGESAEWSGFCTWRLSNESLSHELERRFEELVVVWLLAQLVESSRQPSNALNL